MKIGFFSPYLDTLGGGERYTLTLAAHWSTTHDVHVFWDEENILSDSQRRFNIDLSRTKTVQNIFRSVNMFKKLFLSRHYDLIFFLSDGSIPTSFARHNIIHFQCPFPFVRGKTIPNKLKLFRYRRIVCNSLFTKRYVDKEYGVRADVIYPPVDVTQWKPLPKKKAILSVGRFSRHFINKKQKEMVQFFRTFFLEHPDWQLWLAGGVVEQDFAYFKEVEREAQGLPVKLFPNASFEELQRLYGEASIYWHAAGFGESEKMNPAGMEHFGISTVEAMSAGSVPVVFEGGGQPEIVREGENGFLWKTEEELLEKTNTVIANAALAEELRRKAMETSKQFSVSRFCEAFDKLLYEIT